MSMDLVDSVRLFRHQWLRSRRSSRSKPVPFPRERRATEPDKLFQMSTRYSGRPTSCDYSVAFLFDTGWNRSVEAQGSLLKMRAPTKNEKMMSSDRSSHL